MRFTPFVAPLLIVLAACGGSDGGGTTTPVRVVSRVTVTAPTTTINPGETVQLSAAAFDNAGAQITTPGTFVWSTSSASVASVDQTGKVAGIAAGTAIVTADVSGVKGTLSVRVNPSATTAKDTIFTIGTNSFSPTFLPIKIGSTVVFSLGFDGVGHDVRFDMKNGAPADIPVTVRANVPRTFNVVGDFPYFCPTHPQMIGTITVSP